MARIEQFSLLPLAFGMALVFALDAESQVSVEGAWTVGEWTVDGETRPAQPGLFLFTSTHYSIFFVNQPEPRAVPAQPNPGGMTDAERVVAFEEFTANAGRYVVEGDTLTTRAFVAKSPAYMARWPDNEQRYTVRREGDSLILTFLGNGTVARLVRREGAPGPG